MMGKPITSTPRQALTGSADENEGTRHKANAAKAPVRFSDPDRTAASVSPFSASLPGCAGG